jgi:hypothetical protein
MITALAYRAAFCQDTVPPRSAGQAETTLRGLAPAGSKTAIPVTAPPVRAEGSDVLTEQEYAQLMETPSESYFGGEDKANVTPSVRTKVADMLARSAAQGPDKAIYAAMYRNWMRGVRVLVSSGPRDFDVCIRRKALAISSAGRAIHLCRLEIQNYPETHTIQVLIHELAHVSGYGDECAATRLARGAARASGMSPYENGYIRTGRCPR